MGLAQGELKEQPRNISVEGVGKEHDIYTNRFNSSQELTREITWKVVCKKFLQPMIPANASVLDVGAGDGHFIKMISAKRKIAVDLSEHVQALSKEGIEVLMIPATEMSSHVGERVDVVFMSNFLEHLPDKRTVIQVLEECRRVLKPKGRIMILQPNIRYVGSAYWDYVDHHVALTEKSLAEALDVSGFRVTKLIPRFLPYTAKSTLGSIVRGNQFAWLVGLYIRVPLLWRFFGKQTFVVAEPKGTLV